MSDKHDSQADQLCTWRDLDGWRCCHQDVRDAVADALRTLASERDALKAEVERLTFLHKLDHSLADQWRAKLEKAEAERDNWRKAFMERD